MEKKFSEKFLEKMEKIMQDLDTYGSLLYKHGDKDLQMGNCFVPLGEGMSFDMVLEYLLENYNTNQSAYKITYIDKSYIGLAFDYKSVKALAGEVKRNALYWAKYDTKRMELLIKYQEALGELVHMDSKADVKSQKGIVKQLKKDVEFFDKDTKLKTAESIKIEEIRFRNMEDK